MHRTLRCTIATVLFIATQTSAVADGTIQVIDFEEYAENTQIGLQYKAQFGVEFSIVGGGLPIVAEEGGVGVAFLGPAGADLYMSSGLRGLTDPEGAGGGATNPKSIHIIFDPPVNFASLYLVDIDLNGGGAEKVTVKAYSGLTMVGSQTVNGVAANDGKSVRVELAGASITSLVIEPGPSSNGTWGAALDFLTFKRPCAIPGCAQRFRLSQESSPGASDFSENILGEVPVWGAPGTSASAFYG